MLGPINENNLEVPTFVKSSPNRFNPFNVNDRIAENLPQTIRNSQAYDLTYKDHKDYYNDKKVYSFDENFKETEKFLLKDFKNAIKSQLTADPNLIHANNLNKSRLNLSNILNNSVPKINAESVSKNIFGKNLDSADVKVTSTDPYTTMRSS